MHLFRKYVSTCNYLYQLYIYIYIYIYYKVMVRACIPLTLFHLIILYRPLLLAGYLGDPPSYYVPVITSVLSDIYASI